MPNVSVIIPTHNCGRYLGASIESALNQSYPDLEIIVVNDGSTDNTDSVLERYLKEKRIKYIKNNEKKGLSASRNIAIDASKGNLIAFLDADDIFLKDKIKKQVKLFEINSRIDICYTNEIYFNEEENKEILSTRYHFSGDIFYYMKRSNFIHVSTAMARSGILRKNKFDETLKSHEDWELFLRLAHKGANFAYIKDALSKIRIRKDSMTVDRGVMDKSRREVGLRAKAHRKDFKLSMDPFAAKGRRAYVRYARMKTRALFKGFPKRECFTRPVPQEVI